MLKPRCECSAGEVGSLIERLSDDLKGLALTTQPEVAARVVELVGSGEAGPAEFAHVIQQDPALSGRLLKLANSAYFAQRQPVARVDRACVLLGLERVRAISLGFYLSRSADAASQLSRRMWGESLYRACLASELAQVMMDTGSAEAFLVGLIMDCGLPLMPRLLDDAHAVEHRRAIGHDRSGWVHEPEGVFGYEWSNMPFTHVDVASAMRGLWNLPDVLARPVERHHAPPPARPAQDLAGSLHRVAYYVGAVVLDPALVEPEQDPDASVAERLGVDPERLRGCYARAGEEYKAVLSTFSDVADGVASLDRIQEAVSVQLLSVVERSVGDEHSWLAAREPVQFRVGGVLVEIERAEGGELVAYRRDADGNRLASISFNPGASTEMEVLQELGIEVDPDDVPDVFGETVRALVA